MAQTSKKKRRVLKQAKPETIRERAAKAAEAQPKPHRIRRTISQTGKPVAATGRGIRKVFQPFRFLLRPFKTRPARAVGRFLAKVLLFSYIRNSWHELRQVQWPDRRQTVQLTSAVFIFAIALTTTVAGVDWVLNRLFKEILLK